MQDRLNRTRPRAAALAVTAVVLAAGLSRAASGAPQTASTVKPPTPSSLRLYVFDCGLINVNRAGTERYKVTPEEVGETRFSVPCFLAAHPRGTLLWDLGVIPDAVVEAAAQGARADVNATAAAVVTRTLKSQLAEIGFRPADVTYFAISHAHIDHTANMNQFAASTWLARPAERAFMWEENNARVNPSFYTQLKSSKSIDLKTDEHDVFGDGQVVIKSAPGHSPGHQVLVLRLASTGRVMLSGDLYHYPQERTLRRPPPDTEFNVQQSAASRVMIEEYLRSTSTELWIEHDFVANAKLKKSPAYYD
jgi:N-acyl homoserine lactone hydrolase